MRDYTDALIEGYAPKKRRKLKESASEDEAARGLKKSLYDLVLSTLAPETKKAIRDFDLDGDYSLYIYNNGEPYYKKDEPHMTRGAVVGVYSRDVTALQAVIDAIIESANLGEDGFMGEIAYPRIKPFFPIDCGGGIELFDPRVGSAIAIEKYYITASRSDDHDEAVYFNVRTVTPRRGSESEAGIKTYGLKEPFEPLFASNYSAFDIADELIDF